MIREAFLFAALVASAVAQERIPLDGAWTIVRTEPVVEGAPAQIALPAATEVALGDAFDGIATLSRGLPLRPEWKARRIWIEFDAVATHATVSCNGVDCGAHLGGWTPFSCELTSQLRWDGSDQVAIRIDERVGHNTQGFLPIIQPHFGGVWQNVRLCIDDGLSIDATKTTCFGRLLDGAKGEALARIAIRIGSGVALPADAECIVRIRDGAGRIAESSVALAGEAAAELRIEANSVRPWTPAAPHLYAVEFELRSGGVSLARHGCRIGFRSLAVDGSTIVFNGAPLSVRGVLHWGIGEGQLAPPTDPTWWRAQIEGWKALGFNLIKCCLFVPPPCVHELCDELGMLCWQEYPTWHPKLDQAHQDELLAEYREFFAQDGGHPSVAFRSITCETGHDADLAVVRTLFDACHAAVPDTLVVDDSSWIGWQRVTDFWDEHPYGNHRWLLRRLADFEAHMASHGRKPLLLGECIAADTWVDLAQWDARPHAPQWQRPLCLDDQRRFEAWIVREFGAETMRSIPAIAKDHALALRRAQIELLRSELPYAGYVVSVASDIPKARMGLLDAFGNEKWAPRDFWWHRDRMLALKGLQRAFVTKRGVELRLPVVACGFEARDLKTTPLPSVDTPQRVRVRASAGDVASHWDVWALPEFLSQRPSDVLVLDRLDAASIESIRRGKSALLRVGAQKGALRAEPLWHLRGAPFAPHHPLHRSVPEQMLIDLMPFDLDGERMIPWEPWRDQVDPILAYWETHDIAEVRSHLLAFETRLGKGRLLASTFDPATDAGRYVEAKMLEHLRDGPLPKRALRDETVAALLALCDERTIALETFRFCTDPDDRGTGAGWFAQQHDDQQAPWRDLQAGKHWENQADDLRGYTGIAWYRIAVDIPQDWAGKASRLVLEGVDDSATIWVDGEFVDRRGDPATQTTVWLEPQTIELGERLAPGRHCIALRVVDHAGSGGLWRKAFVTTGPAGILRELLR